MRVQASYEWSLTVDRWIKFHRLWISLSAAVRKKNEMKWNEMRIQKYAEEGNECCFRNSLSLKKDICAEMKIIWDSFIDIKLQFASWVSAPWTSFPFPLGHTSHWEVYSALKVCEMDCNTLHTVTRKFAMLWRSLEKIHSSHLLLTCDSFPPVEWASEWKSECRSVSVWRKRSVICAM